MDKKWPLHPKPHQYQLLYDWTAKLAEVYGISHRCFYRNVLELTNEEISALRRELPQKALFILSNGTGILLDDLYKRDLNTIFKMLFEEITQYEKDHPEEFANLLNNIHP